MAQGRLIIVCGLPGSGKTTLATRLEQQLPAVRFCPDDWFESLQLNFWDEPLRARIEALQWQMARQLLSLGQTVIIEWGTWAREERDALRNGARELGAAVELRYMSEPIDVLVERVQRRGKGDPPLSRDHIVAFSERFEVPTAEEMSHYDELEPIPR
ncbi:ATP-binding protein [bacterium]|nr:MAG: ATP-binding protein [bacterium]